MEREGIGGFELLVIVIAGIALALVGAVWAAGGSRSQRRRMLRLASRPT